MRAKLEYLTQYPVEKAGKRSGDLVIQFRDTDARIKIKDWPGKAPEIDGLTLLKVTRAQGGDSTILFGRATEDGIIESQEVAVNKDMKYKIDMPGYDDEDRDVSVPPHPDERTAAGPTTPTETKSPRRSTKK